MGEDMFLVPFVATLRDGTRALIREVGPEDRHHIEVGFDHLSTRSQYFRFLASVSKLSDRQLSRFTRENTPDHVAIGAISPGPDPAEPMGIARFVRLPDRPSAAEFAVTVVDDFQGLGLGTLLLGVLARIAHDQHVSRFMGLVHARNSAMRNLLDELGGTVHRRDGIELGITIPLHEDPADYPATPAGEAFRQAYRLARTPGPDRQARKRDG